MESPPCLSAHWLSTLVLICSVLSTHSVDTKIHEHMTPDELRSVFYVEDHSSIPEYHLVHLTHHLARRHIHSSHRTNLHTEANGKTPHEKGISKPWKTETSPPSLLNDEMFVKAREYIKDVDIIGDLNATVDLNFDVPKSSESESSDSEVSGSDREHVVDGQEVGVHKIELEAFGKPLKLVLKKQEGLFKKEGLKVWKALENDTLPHGVDYEEMVSDNEEDLGEVYQDEENGAALLIRRHPKHGKLLVEGSLGHDLVIRPMPDSVTAAAAAQDDEMFMDSSSMADMVSIDTGLPIVRRQRVDQETLSRVLNGAHHVIIRKAPAEHDHLGDYAFMEPDHLSKRFRRKRSIQSHTRRKRDAPYVIYPEILVIVDYDGYRLHGGDNVQIKRYFVSFWNGVDLRYKLLKGPRIRISIAGIIISRGRDATPYLERNRVGRDAIDSAAALTDMGKYLFRERRLPVYDIAVAITKLDMCRRQYANDACNRGTAGFAYVGGACVVNKRLEKVNSVAIIEDTGGFSGIIVAAHEVGHLLGAVHDGSPPPSYLGGPGAEKCRWEDGFIMSDLRHTEKGFRWSPCSVQSFHHFLNGDTATCLFNSPHEDDSLPRMLPGRLLTLDAQCRKDRGTSACFKDERVCAQLFCFDAASGYCVAYRPAAEGSPCGDGQYCINGRCITEHENIIPDYSQHTPSYVRPETSPFFSNITSSYEASTQPILLSSPGDYNQNNYYSQKQETDSPQPEVYTQKPEIYSQKPEYYSQKPEYYSQKPEYYSQKPEYYSQKPEYYSKKPEYYSQKPEYYSQQQEYYSQNPEINQNSIVPTSPTTANPYKYFYYTTSSTQRPSEYKFATKTTSITQPPSLNLNQYSVSQPSSTYPPSINKYSITSTKSPYDFKDYTTKTIERTDSKRGFYNRDEFDTYFGRSTTKSPYQDKGRKSLYKIGTYYQGKSNDNSIRPDANSQQIQVEPARLLFQYQRNLSTGEIVN